MPGAQMILVDTPGIHHAASALNRAIVADAIKSLEETDAALLMTSPSPKIPEDDRRIMDILGSSTIRSILAINKIDRVQREEPEELETDNNRILHK